MWVFGSFGLDSFEDPSAIVKIKGTTATKLTAPSPGAAEDIFYGATSVKTSKGRDVWEVGDYQKTSSTGRRTLIVEACGV